MTATTELRKFLESLVAFRRKFEHETNVPETAYLSLDDLVLREGREHRYERCPADIELGAPKECYRNAFNLMVERPDLTYVEGYAHSGLIPTAHA